MALKKQVNGHKLQPEDDPSSIGNVAISSGICTELEFNKLLESYWVELEKHNYVPIGEFMVQRGVMTEEQRDLLLAKQNRMRTDQPSAEDIRFIINVAKRSQEKQHKAFEDLKALVSRAVKA